MPKVLRIGLPSVHSRLHPKVMDILGLPYQKDPCHLTYFSKSVGLFFIRGWDIAKMVEMEKLDIAFCGYDTIAELGLKVQVVKKFEEFKYPIGLCRPKGEKQDLVEKLTIATEYPNLVKDYFNENFEIEVIHVHGATEAYAHLPNIDAIVDIVETGRTLECNNLYLDRVIFETYPCLISRNDLINISTYSVKKISNLIKNTLSGSKG
jgi:ATP phosphoribosyltransferase